MPLLLLTWLNVTVELVESESHGPVGVSGMVQLQPSIATHAHRTDSDELSDGDKT
jgi:hypothetical protein